MAGRLRLLFLILPLIGVPMAALAADGTPQAIEPALERRQITAAAIDTENLEFGIFGGIISIEDFGTQPVYGLRLAYHVSEDLFLEAAYGRSKAGETSYESLSGNVQLLTGDERKFSYYNLSVGYNLLPGEVFVGSRWAFNSALYVIGGIGSTSFADDKHFTFNVGFGYRLLATDWLALHLDVRDHIFNSDLLGKDKTTHNLELHGGITVFF